MVFGEAAFSTETFATLTPEGGDVIDLWVLVPPTISVWRNIPTQLEEAQNGN